MAAPNRYTDKRTAYAYRVARPFRFLVPVHGAVQDLPTLANATSVDTAKAYLARASALTVHYFEGSTPFPPNSMSETSRSARHRPISRFFSLHTVK